MPRDGKANSRNSKAGSDTHEIFSPQQDVRPTNKYLTELTDGDGDYCVMLCTLPHGVVVPMHSHVPRCSLCCYRVLIHWCGSWQMAVDASFSLLTGNDIGTRRIRAGGVIFREGETADELFVIKSGYVRIQVGNRTMADLTTDNIFGEMALIDSEPRSATAVAITDVELVPISEKQFLFLVTQTPYFALKVMRILAQRLRVTSKSLD